MLLLFTVLLEEPKPESLYRTSKSGLKTIVIILNTNWATDSKERGTFGRKVKVPASHLHLQDPQPQRDAKRMQKHP